MGIISGKVTRSNGQPHPAVEVCAKVPGLAGGVTRSVRTDCSGNFMLEWSGTASYVEAVYVRGRILAQNIASGRNNLHLLLD
jgi:hypothetical protein